MLMTKWPSLSRSKNKLEQQRSNAAGRTKRSAAARRIAAQHDAQARRMHSMLSSKRCGVDAIIHEQPIPSRLHKIFSHQHNPPQTTHAVPVAHAAAVQRRKGKHHHVPIHAEDVKSWTTVMLQLPRNLHAFPHPLQQRQARISELYGMHSYVQVLWCCAVDVVCAAECVAAHIRP